MNILAIDTTSDELVLVLLCHSKVIIRKDKQIRKHNQILMPHIDELLNENSLALSDIDYFGVCVGPGSFTGIRLGINTINAFSFVTMKKIVTFTVFDVLSYNAMNYLAVVESGHGMFYGEKKENGIVEQREFSQQEIEQTDLPIKKEYVAENIAPMLEQKIINKEYTNIAQPLYLKKSQPERLEDENKKSL